MERHDLNRSFVTGSLDELVWWAHRCNSAVPATSGLAVETTAAGAGRDDLAGFGMEIVRCSPRDADLMIAAGGVSQKMARLLQGAYAQMVEPRWVISIGVGASSGGVSSSGGVLSNYATVQVDQIVPVDLHARGSQLDLETLRHAILTFDQEIRNGEVARWGAASVTDARVHFGHRTVNRTPN
jgi:NADH-quinone oxidoreductase subunit B